MTDRLGIQELGGGDAILLLHGTPTSPNHLEALARRLARHHRVLLAELPGYGRSPALVPWSLTALYVLIEEELVARGDRHLSVVGFSGGAYHALALTARGVLCVAHVVALAGFADLTAEERTAMRASVAALRAGVDFKPLLAGIMLSPSAQAHDPAAMAEVSSWMDATSRENLAAELEAMAAAPDLREGLRETTASILARVGALDVACPVIRSERFVRARPGATLEVVTGVGHALLLEDFEATAASIERALA